jgi:enoyl-CoA hydratase/carnithine racemase
VRLAQTSFGLVTAVVPDQNVWAKAAEVAMKLAGKPAEALRACKKLIKAPERGLPSIRR